MTAQDLKNSVLQLAMHGKLVEQRAEEGTARELLEQIEIEKKRLIKERKLKKEKPLPMITKKEIPFEIPENWEWVRLGNIVSVYGGKRIPAGRKLTELDTGHKYIRVSDMKNGSVNLDDIKYLEEDIYQKIKAYTISKDDIYITVAGTIGQIGTIPVELDNANLTENADKLILYKANKNFMLYMLSSPMVQGQIQEATTQVGQPKLAIMRIQLLKVLLPPYEEQKRIVAKIEELLSNIDKYDKAYSKLETFYKKFPADMRKSILQYAMQGKLVEQKPEEGTGGELYCQIQTEKEKLIKAGTIKKERLLPEISEAEKPFDIPTSWRWVRLAEICEQKPVTGYSPKNVDYITEVKKLTLTATTAGYFKPDAFKYVDVDKDKVSKYWLKHNDLLIQRSNSRELVGTSCIYTGNDDEYIYPDLMMRVRILQGVELVYLDYALKSPATRYYFSQKATGTSSSMPKINQDIVANTLIPLPPLQEQRRIVKELKKIIPYCEKLYMRPT